MTALEDVVTRSPRLSSRTRDLYLQSVQAFLDYTGRSPRKWTSNSVDRWRTELLKARLPQTVNVYLNALRYASRRWASKGGRDFAAEASGLTPKARKPRTVLSTQQAKRLVRACHGEMPIDLRDRALCVLGLRAGLSRATLCSATLEDLTSRGLVVQLKGGEKESITLDAEMRDAVRPWVQYLRSCGVTTGPLLRGLTRPKKTGQVTVHKALSSDGLYRAVKLRASQAGLGTIDASVFVRTHNAWGGRVPDLY
jgi:site-specific recombinase XerD